MAQLLIAVRYTLGFPLPFPLLLVVHIDACSGLPVWQSNLNIGDRIDMIDGVPVRGKSQRQLAGVTHRHAQAHRATRVV